MKELLNYIKKNKWDYELTDDLLWFAYNTDNGVRKHFIDFENKTFHCEFENEDLEIAGFVPFELLLLIAEAIKP